MVEAEKPDFKNGFSIRDLADGAMALGQVEGEDVVLACFGDEFFAVGANCTHYHGMLSGGSSLATLCDIPCTTLVSVSGVEKPYPHLHSTRFPTGA